MTDQRWRSAGQNAASRFRAPHGAQQRFQASLTIAERLAAADPTNTAWQRDLSISHERLANLASLQVSRGAE